MSVDPFSLPEPTKEERRNRHFLGPNGLWLFPNFANSYKDSFLNEKCLCGCIRKYHLDADSICLNSQCLMCGEFISKKSKVIPPTNTKTTKTKKQDIQEPIKVPRTNHYVEELVEQLAP